MIREIWLNDIIRIVLQIFVKISILPVIYLSHFYQDFAVNLHSFLPQFSYRDHSTLVLCNWQKHLNMHDE